MSEAKKISDNELEKVSGGNKADRKLVLDALRNSGYGEYLVAGSSDADTLKKTCAKFNIKYSANALLFDTFEFDGHKYSSMDLSDSKKRAQLEEYIKKQL